MGLDRWTEEGIKRLQAEGKSQREIARILGVNLKTVNRRCKAKPKPEPKVPAGVNPMIERLIDLSTVPDMESVSTDILVLYRHTLAELQKRMPEMSVNEIYTLSMELLRQINRGDGDVES